MALENYAYIIVLLFAVIVILISVSNIFAFDKNNEDETIYIVLNIITIVLSIGIIIWVIVILFRNSAKPKSDYIKFEKVSQSAPDYQEYIRNIGLDVPETVLVPTQKIPGKEFIPRVRETTTTSSQNSGLSLLN